MLWMVNSKVIWKSIHHIIQLHNAKFCMINKFTLQFFSLVRYPFLFFRLEFIKNSVQGRLCLDHNIFKTIVSSEVALIRCSISHNLDLIHICLSDILYNCYSFLFIFIDKLVDMVHCDFAELFEFYSCERLEVPATSTFLLNFALFDIFFALLLHSLCLCSIFAEL